MICISYFWVPLLQPRLRSLNALRATWCLCYTPNVDLLDVFKSLCFVHSSCKNNSFLIASQKRLLYISNYQKTYFTNWPLMVINVLILTCERKGIFIAGPSRIIKVALQSRVFVAIQLDPKTLPSFTCQQFYWLIYMKTPINCKNKFIQNWPIVSTT